MADIVAAKPASGAPIESTWGAEIHDQIEGIQTGTVVVNLSSSSVGTTAVVFPRAYATPPKVFLTVSISSSAAFVHAWIGSGGPISTTGFTCAAGRDDAGTNTAAITVQWMAIGTPA